MVEDDDATADFSTSTDGSEVDVESDGIQELQPRRRYRKQDRDEAFDSKNTKILLFIGFSSVAMLLLLFVLAKSGQFDSEKAQDEE